MSSPDTITASDRDHRQLGGSAADGGDLRCWDRLTSSHPGLVVVSGPNGAGKTSLVEAICYGMVGVSPRTTREADAIRVGRQAFHVELHVDGPHGRQVREMGYQPGSGGACGSTRFRSDLLACGVRPGRTP